MTIFETWAPVVQWLTVQIAMTLAVKMHLISVQCNITASFIHTRTGCHPSWRTLLHLGFFLVHSYARVGLYRFSTVINCRLAHAQIYRYAKVQQK